jgi:hypothetical protein
MHLNFQHGGGGNLESSRSFPIISGIENFKLNIFLLVFCIKFHQNRVVIAHFTGITSINKMGAAAILKLDLRLSFCGF